MGDDVQQPVDIVDRQGSLAGEWEATRLLSGEFSSLVADTRITAMFDVEGRVSGSAGCNRYTATFSAAETSIEVSSAAVTRMFCVAPEGVMEQEATYLSHLEQAVSFAIVEPVLELYDADGVRLVSYERVVS